MISRPADTVRMQSGMIPSLAKSPPPITLPALHLDTAGVSKS